MTTLEEKLEEVLTTKKTTYLVDREGNIYWQYSTRLEKLKGRISDNGYHKIQVGTTMYYVHRLVARAYIPNPDNKPCVNHIDGNKLNNRVENLEWVTHSENMRHAFDTGLYQARKGSKQNNAKLTESIVSEIKSELAKGTKGTLLAKRFGVAHGRIYDIKHGRSWTHVLAGITEDE